MRGLDNKSAEIERANKVAEYYGIEIEIVDFNLSKQVPDVLEDLKDTMKSNFIASPNIFTHGILNKNI